ncbi:hypothetical protein MNB_SV-9-1558 [hydrothermal vent metagenome]|uniref:Uncharacterized protein n=1 Tax=hydrothermal vent metagenome TaxID=652676 RepID=A0A1W1BGM9_9ZZZZ
MSLMEKYPKIFGKLEDKDLVLRHLLGIDENYEDYDSEEYEFNFEEFNFVIYIAEPIQEILGEDNMNELLVKLSENSVFENFRADEIDLYGVKTSLNEDELATLLLNQIESIL